MKRNWIKTAALLLIGGILMLSLFGCGAEKYPVDYDGRKSSFENAKDRYPAGAKVKLYFGMIATDTDYSFYLNGQRLNPGYEEAKGYVIEFTMPAHAVKLTYDARNSMVYEPEKKEAPYLIVSYETGTSGTDGYDDSRSLRLSTTEGEELLLVREDVEADGTETVERFAVPFDAAYECAKLIETFGLREWKYLEEPECIDGGYSTVRFRNDDGSYEQVSTGHMPADGERQLDQIGN
ncbi:MAG: hypothetical protein IKD72_06460, partial [Clostridia bacterium]|nr:hypothetical protein [Clostridia bacterium]